MLLAVCTYKLFNSPAAHLQDLFSHQVVLKHVYLGVFLRVVGSLAVVMNNRDRAVVFLLR